MNLPPMNQNGTIAPYMNIPAHENNQKVEVNSRRALLALEDLDAAASEQGTLSECAISSLSSIASLCAAA